jgi:hypothetical protein
VKKQLCSIALYCICKLYITVKYVHLQKYIIETYFSVMLEKMIFFLVKYLRVKCGEFLRVGDVAKYRCEIGNLGHMPSTIKKSCSRTH